jgi:hypothetical protein
MDLSILDESLINNIIMYQRPVYPYIKELNYISKWFTGEDDRILNMTKSSWILDAIDLRNYFKKEFLYNQDKMLESYYYQYDIAFNLVNVRTN